MGSTRTAAYLAGTVTFSYLAHQHHGGGANLRNRALILGRHAPCQLLALSVDLAP
jgi:hypothetical protein